MANAVRHGVIAVQLQGITGLTQRQLHVMAVEQALGQGPAQGFGPVTEQGPGRGRGIQKTPVRGMARNQVRGVFGNQPVQAPGLGRLTPGQQLATRFTPASHHALAVGVGDQGPEPHLLTALRLYLLDCPVLPEAGTHQLRQIAGQ